MARLVTITGPDGAGKTAVADALEARSREPVVRAHHRLRSLPHRRGSTEETDGPHGREPYGPLLSRAKVLYLWLDHLVGWRRLRRRPGIVLLERGWWDLLVDPARYRLRPHPTLVGALGRFLPSGTTVALVADPSVVRGRKDELVAAEIARQVDLWHELADVGRGITTVAADADLDTVVRRVECVLERPAPRRVVRLGLADRRLEVPVDDRRVAAASLQLYQPLRRVSRAAWHVARIAACTGALSLLPPASPSAAVDLLEERLEGLEAVATLEGSTSGRASALLFDGSGRPTAVAKVALDEANRARLRTELRAARTYGPQLPEPLHTPAVVGATDGVVLFEVVSWRPRPRPLELPEDVARALGRFHRRHVDGQTGLGHGDLTPWNLMRSDRGWEILDWEEAGGGRPPFGDVFNWFVQCHLCFAWPAAEDLLDGLSGRGPVGAALVAYAEGAGLDTGELRQCFVTYLAEAPTHWRDPSPEVLARLAGLLELVGGGVASPRDG